MSDPRPIRIAMWSGPRNISTAMMRAWENRPDTAVIDEPLYAHYLRETGLAHPGAAEVIAHCETDWRRVVMELTGEIPTPAAAGRTPPSIIYQKHMAHHLLPHIDRAWVLQLRNAFLIRQPHEMLTSLLKHIPDARLEDTGLPQQVELFQELRGRTGEAPPVLDARDVLEHPWAMLRALCARLGVAFSDRMLHWPPGPRDSDGVWAKHWYESVNRSTGFAPYRPKDEDVPPDKRDLLGECQRYYETLYEHRLRPE